MVAFGAGGLAQYLGFRRFLGARLHDEDLELRRGALVRWAGFAIAWQLFVIVADVAWVVPFAAGHARGYLWAAPPIGLLLGTALPLQVVVVAIMRANRARS